MNVARRVALAAMVLVSAWSLWMARPRFDRGRVDAWGAGRQVGPAAIETPAWAQSSPTRGEEGLRVASPPRGPRVDRMPAAPAPEGSRPGRGFSVDEQPAPINWFEFGTETPPFIATIVNFGILVAGFYLLGKRPIATALKNRRDSISKEIEEAQRMKREAEARAEFYQAKLEKLEEEVQIAREALVRAGEAERDRIVADAEAKAERMRREAQFLVLQEVKQIRQDLLRDTLEAAITSAEQLLKTRVTPADQERLAEDYLADLGGKPRSERSPERVLPAEPGAGNSS